MLTYRIIFLALTLAAALLLPVHAEDAASYWPNWRGPNYNGVSTTGNPPVEWSETNNVRFKVKVPGSGLSSPVVWGDRIFVMTSAALDEAAYEASLKSAAEVLERNEWPPSVMPVKQQFLLLAYSRKDGSLLWQRVANESVPHESHYIDSAWSCASPITDGKRVYAHFGSNGTYAYDLDGKLLWEIDLGDMTTRSGFGEGSSPALYGDTLVINWDHEGDSFLVALDATTGKQRWRVERPGEVTSWATPLIVTHDGKQQVVIPATGRSRGYDLKTGKELWSVAGMTVNTIPTPVHRKGVVYLASGYGGTMLQAIDLTVANGPLEETNALSWVYERDTPYVPSMLLYDNSLYFFKHFKNILSVLDATTGKPLRPLERIKTIGSVWASPIAAAGRIYVFDRAGNAIVFEHGPEMKVLAENKLDGKVDATPAIAGNELYVRTGTHLYALQSSEPKAAPISH
jgi:outer membrane protein assembly factor BamB